VFQKTLSKARDRDNELASREGRFYGKPFEYPAGDVKSDLNSMRGVLSLRKEVLWKCFKTGTIGGLSELSGKERPLKTIQGEVILGLGVADSQ